MSNIHVTGRGSGLEDTVLLGKCALLLSCLIKSEMPSLAHLHSYLDKTSLQTGVVPWPDHVLLFMATLSDESCVRKWGCWGGGICPSVLPHPPQKIKKNSRTWKYTSFPSLWSLNKGSESRVYFEKKQTREIKVQSFGVRARPGRPILQSPQNAEETQ